MFGVFADIRERQALYGNRLQTPRRTGSKGKETQNPESFEKPAPNPSRNTAQRRMGHTCYIPWGGILW